MLTPAEQRTAFEAALAALGLPPAMLDRFEPWYAAMALSTLPLLRDGFATEKGVEKMLDARAKALASAHIRRWKRAEFQIGLFDSLPPDVQKRYLVEVVDNLPTMNAIELGADRRCLEGRAMPTAWQADQRRRRSRRTIGCCSPTATGPGRTGSGRRLDKPGTVFIAVGAGHLAGPGSVQDQLAARGMATTRVQ